MNKTKMTQTLRRQAGYTIDQTILIVAVIAILVTMIVGSVGWDLLTRAGSTKLQSHLVQFENSAGSFFAQYNMWPHQASATPADGNVNFRTLLDETALQPAMQGSGEFRNYLPAYNVEAGVVNHPFGAGTGVVTLNTDTDGGQTYIVFEMTLIPSEEFNRADEGVDGRLDWQIGRLRANVDPSGAQTVTLRYFANVIN